jgi:hypothetical protein
MTVRTVTGDVTDISGALTANASFVVVPLDTAFGADADTLVLGNAFRVTADGSGEFTFDAEEGYYALEYQTSRGAKVKNFTIDATGPWGMGRLIGLTGPFTPGAVQQALDAATRAERALAIARVVQVTTSRDIADTDAGALLQVDSASLVTLTIPTDAAAGWSETLFVSILRDGVGACRIVAGAGVTLTGVGVEDNATEIANIHGFAQIVRVGPNDWRATGWITEVPA